MDELKPIAHEALDVFARISGAAENGLRERGTSLDAFAVINQATAEKMARDLQNREEDRQSNLEALRLNPAIARMVIADEDDNRELLYVTSRGTVENCGVALCSYMSPKGRLVPLDIGDGLDLPLPGGKRWFEVLEKTTFQAQNNGDGWDARPARHYRENLKTLTIRSMRALLREDGVTEEQIDDAISQWLAEDALVADNISEGIQHEALTVMQLRVAQILDRIQDGIFRLPLDSQIAVLGPPGTGKTTTLIRRLRQKLDFAYLDPDTERPLVMEPDSAGLSHPDSWLMFSPTELLQEYVKEAFGKEGVPVHDERVWTWDNYRRKIIRDNLRILRTGRSAGFVLKDEDALLLPETLSEQTVWFDAFDRFQSDEFLLSLQSEAERLEKSENPDAAVLGRQVLAAFGRSSDDPFQLMAEIAGMWERLRKLADSQRDPIRVELAKPLQTYANLQGYKFLNDLTKFVEALSTDQNDAGDDAEDEAEEEDEDDETRPNLRGRQMVMDVFVKAMRAHSISQAGGRAPGAKSRAGRLLAWLKDRDLVLPELGKTGQVVLEQRASLRLLRCANDYLGKIRQRYVRFRRVMRDKESWYPAGKSSSREAHPLEVDLIALAILRNARAMEENRFLIGRLGDRLPPMLHVIRQLRRNQILVDEATDFSPVQLACMRHLADPKTDSFFLSGDFNQRLTRWGSRSEGELRWVAPNLEVKEINITYRQSRNLADFARALAHAQGYEVNDQAPADRDNAGVDPVVGLELTSIDDQADWISSRIREIESIAEGILPTIAVLTCTEDTLETLAAALSAKLEDLNIRASACPKGKVKGQAGDVRVFSVEHIKGLEFEAVFFVGVDELAQIESDLFDRFIYVGATRAATFLGLTSGDDRLPASLEGLESRFGRSWS